MKEKHVLLFDSIVLIKKSLEMIVRKNHNDANIMLASTVEEVEEFAKIICFDLVIMDINFEKKDNFYLIKTIKKLQPKTKILIFSFFDDINYKTNCFKYGASAFLNKYSTEENIKMTINVLYNGSDYFLNDVKIKYLDSISYEKDKIKPIKGSNLSLRELQIAQMLIEGENNSAISKKLKLAMSTISTYKKRILLKSSAKNILELSVILKKLK
jgi:DNA-binding NarL/FixJ family response regulator